MYFSTEHVREMYKHPWMKLICPQSCYTQREVQELANQRVDVPCMIVFWYTLI